MMATLVWCGEVGAAYLAVSFVLAVVIGRCLRGNSVDYPVVDGYVTPLPAEMAAFAPDDCVKVDSRARIRPVNLANLRRKQAATVQPTVAPDVSAVVRPTADRSIETV